MRYIAIILILLIITHAGFSQDHPSIILTKGGVEEIKRQREKLPIMDQSFNQVEKEVKEAMKNGIQVPLPKDLAGGYSHEQHKRNFFALQKAGVLFQLTEDERYAVFIRDVLLEYARLFPGIDRHPATRSYAPGKFFWQCLNDANWLVYVSQAYDCIYDWLDPKVRKKLNKQLFRPYADFLSNETPQFFNRIHNHSTWGNAAVGMIGLVMDDEELVQRALYGASNAVSSNLKKDNDGGTIDLSGKKEAGFLAQIDHAFSPDGYYTEGPYYQRYAMYPFLIFAQALQNKKPDLKIFDYKQGVLIKGVYALLNQTNAAGEFFPLNDAQKGMSFLSRELVTAVNIAYHFGAQDMSLLSIVQQQGRVPLNDTGLSTARALTSGKVASFTKKSLELKDGASGTEGGIGILRSRAAENDFALVMKYSKHGMGHGHFDRLSLTFYQGEDEVYQDYGAARWVNIEQKDGGGYLKENTTWAKQTIAHNTVTVNQKSQFNANVGLADEHHPTPYLFDTANPEMQVVSAKESIAYSGIEFHRTTALIENDLFSNPVLLDFFRVTSDSENATYDLPFYFQGEVMKTNFTVEQPPYVKSLAKGHGYQHLGVEAIGQTSSGNAVLNWLYKGHFHTLTAVTGNQDSLIFGRIGKADPSFNLRRDPVFMLRKSNVKNAFFASVTESHGKYSTVTEIATEAYGNVKALEVLRNDANYSVLQVITKNDKRMVFALCNDNNEPMARHSVTLDNETLQWEGPVALIQRKLMN
ncbi:alginate lyase family protein [Fulvivirga sp. M361]|uniref:heparinase II/III domain-containing protein n=1 Tax=Fulvivirga sp. M361 TaxID=2594266 RepID=UPI00117A75D4|nr:heparinase II/III family protein [Fulvivirga sp. M361]TRX59518.1 alginate lyase family protein [Fulvivirga sp. M361]